MRLPGRNVSRPRRLALISPKLVNSPSKPRIRRDFLPLGSGQEAPKACKVEFDLRYAFSSRPLELVLSPVFDRVANTFVESFVKRAEQVYGPR